MDGNRQPQSLEGGAADCMWELEALKHRSQHSHRISPTKEYMEAVAREVHDNLMSLRVWITELSSAVQTDNESITKATAHLVEALYHSILSARESLNKRLRCRRLYLTGFIPGKR